MYSTYFKNKKITVFGLGLHGGAVGVIKFLNKYGARLIVTDIKTKEQLASSLEKLKGLKNIEYVLGQHRTQDFTKVDMVIKNPGASWNNPYIKSALENKVPVEVDSSLFFRLCKCPIIGITGTKGKTTTATLIHDILKVAGKNVMMVGVGQVSVLDKIDSLKKDSVVVFELSSWRLSALGRAQMSPKIAVLTNLYPDHLNYYKSLAEYLEDKRNIFKYQKATDWLIYNGDQEIFERLNEETKSKTIKFCSSRKVGESECDVFLENGSVYLDNRIDSKKMINVSDLKVLGEHNVPNVMAAIGAAYAFGIDLESIKKGVLKFVSIPHRLEFVRELNGIKYYNDTAATIPQATVSALNSFKEPIILICGGSDKNLDFSSLGKEIFEKAKGLVFLKGEATEKLINSIRVQLPEIEKKRGFEVVFSMEKAVEFATQIAEKGDIVLLSPGAASFGMFNNEFDRGEKFREAVKKLK